MASDKRDYTDTGMRGRDPREGFGDDMGTRIGRPDGESDASSARPAPRDASRGSQPGQPGTNADAVADGIEGSIMHEGRSDVTDNDAVNPPPPAGNERRIDNL